MLQNEDLLVSALYPWDGWSSLSLSTRCEQVGTISDNFFHQPICSLDILQLSGMLGSNNLLWLDYSGCFCNLWHFLRKKKRQFLGDSGKARGSTIDNVEGQEIRLTMKAKKRQMNGNEGQEENENSRRGNKCSVLSFKNRRKIGHCIQQWRLKQNKFQGS